jgi:hypothetical protein
MIVDELVSRVPGLRSFVEQAHIIQVPFPVASFENRDDGGIAYRHDADTRPPEHLVPKRSVDGGSWSWDSSWARAPYEQLVLMGSAPQRGIITIRAHAEGAMIPMSHQSAEWCHLGTFQDLLKEFSANMPWTGPPVTTLIWADMISATYPVVVAPVRLAFTEDGGVYADPIADYVAKAEHPHPGVLDVWIARCRRAFVRYGLNPLNGAANPVGLTYSLEGSLESILTTFALMNCKNIVEREVPPAIQPRAARRRGEPWVSYRHHVLEVRPFSRRKIADGAPLDPGSSTAIHWVRGHFKRYTQERPLLGRFTGTYWWQPHLAGRAPRFVSKDYALATGAPDDHQ